MFMEFIFKRMKTSGPLKTYKTCFNAYTALIGKVFALNII